MTYYIIAGEASGDLHGSNLIKAIQQKDSKATIRCWGGDKMKDTGATLVRHYKELAFMGFVEVLTNLSAIFKNIAFCKNDIAIFKPDALIFIDYSGFNLRIAKWAKEQGIRTHYYIAPQIWASREGRIKKIKRDINALYVILPFEKDFYETKHHYAANFVGHPLLDVIADRPTPNATRFKTENNLHATKPIIALLPGSRKQEVEKMLAVMLSLTETFNSYQFVIAGAPSLSKEFYAPFLINNNVAFIENKTYDLLSCATAALVTSGTATLETALFNVPQVVCYKANWLSYQIAKRIITLKYISLVNLIIDAPVVTELIQNSFNNKNLTAALTPLLDGDKRTKQLAAYKKLSMKLGGAGASKKTATLIIQKTKAFLEST